MTTKIEKQNRAESTLALIEAAPVGTGVTTEAIANHLRLDGNYRRQQAVASVMGLVAAGKAVQLDTTPVTYASTRAPVVEAIDYDAMAKPALIAKAVERGLVAGVRAGRATSAESLRKMLKK